MAETEITTPKSLKLETTPDGDDSRTTVALSEENLLALLGSPSASPVSTKPAPAPTPAPVESSLAHLSAAQPPVVDNGKQVTPNAAPTSPPPVSTPVAARPAPTVVANPTVPVVTPRKVSPPQPPPESVDNTLALLAAIKENRAGLLRTEASAKPVPPPVPATNPAPAPKLAPPAKVEQTNRPELAATSAPVPAKTVAPAPLTISERIERHPAMPSSRHASAPAGASLPSSFLSAAPAPSPLAAAIDKVPGGRLTLLIAGALIAVGGISTGLILRSHKTVPAPRVAAAAAPAPAAAPATNFPLQLQLEPQDKGQINVRWNPQSTLIAQSREGRLVITENNQKPRTIPLALDQLKFGHLTYQPQTDRVEFRLEVVDPSGSVAEESVLSLANPPAPGGSAGNPQATPPAANATLTAGAQKIGAPPAPVAAANGNRPAARTFTPPSLNRTPEQGSIVDAPPVLTTNTAAPAPLVNLQVPRAVAPPPLVANALSATAAPRQLQVESSLQAAKLIKKVTPTYPPLAKSARVQGTIHFKATIGKDGTVQNLETVGGPALLRQSAIDAVKQWKYQPTVLNGQPVEVVTSIDVLFTLGQ